MNLQVEPIAVPVRTSCVVFCEVVVWICNPERSRCLVCIEQRPRSLSLHYQVSVDLVVSFDSILDEDVVSLHIINDIVCQS